MALARIAVWVIAALPLSAQHDATGGKGINFYSLEKEAALGKQLAAGLLEANPPLENSAVQEYVDRLGRKLALHIPYAGPDFTFTVVTGDPCPSVHEPAGLPGGHVFVPAALFLAAHDEAEFAGMLAHTMEHIAERHGTRQATRGQIAGAASVPLVFMGSSGCAAEGAVPLGFLPLQRDFERQADFLAVPAMARAGFDPHALARYIERVQPPASTRATTALPAREERIAVLLSAIAKVPAFQYPPAGDDFEAAREQIRLSPRR